MSCWSENQIKTSKSNISFRPFLGASNCEYAPISISKSFLTEPQANHPRIELCLWVKSNFWLAHGVMNILKMWLKLFLLFIIFLCAHLSSPPFPVDIGARCLAKIRELPANTGFNAVSEKELVYVVSPPFHTVPPLRAARWVAPFIWRVLNCSFFLLHFVSLMIQIKIFIRDIDQHWYKFIDNKWFLCYHESFEEVFAARAKLLYI